MTPLQRNNVLRDHLLFHRQDAGLSRPAMAARLGISAYALKEMEQGLKRIPDALMFKVADDLAVDPAKLFHPYPVPERK